jgi:hypothetical protein
MPPVRGGHVIGQHRWLATLWPLWSISTTSPLTRASASYRITPKGTEYQELSTVTGWSGATRACGPQSGFGG